MFIFLKPFLNKVNKQMGDYLNTIIFHLSALQTYLVLLTSQQNSAIWLVIEDLAFLIFWATDLTLKMLDLMKEYYESNKMIPLVWWTQKKVSKVKVDISRKQHGSDNKYTLLISICTGLNISHSSYPCCYYLLFKYPITKFTKIIFYLSYLIS